MFRNIDSKFCAAALALPLILSAACACALLALPIDGERRAELGCD